jgi:hypothetical protein
MMVAPLFALGSIRMTPGALELLAEVGESPARLVLRHLSGDWGDVSSEDARELSVREYIAEAAR